MLLQSNFSLYDVYDVYDDSRRYTNATNTSTSDIMKEMVPYLPHRSSSVCVVYWEGWGRLLVNSCNINGALFHRCCITIALL